MADLIDRQSVVDIAMCYCPDDDGSCSKAGVDIRELLDEIENLPAVNRWIPCSDRMPEEKQRVLISTEYGTRHIAHYRKEQWHPDGYEGAIFKPFYVLAWMPMPDAYESSKREVQEDDNIL